MNNPPPATVAPTNGKKLRNPLVRDNNLYGYLFMTPYIIGLLGFIILPFIYSLYLSFTDYNILSEATWIGTGNYIKMFTLDPKFWVSFKVTLKFAFVQVPLKLVIQLLVAIILSKATKLTNVYRACFYIPSLVGGGVAVALTWKQLWSNRGVINTVLSSLGIPTVNWLNNPSTALYVLILLGVWQFGAGMLIFLAALSDVPRSLYEAAIVDGATSVKRFFKITLPLLTPSIFFNLVQGLIGSMQAFSSAYLISGGKPLNTTLYFGLYQYTQAFEYLNMGYASAMAWFMMIVIVAMTALVFRSNGAWVYYQDEL